MLDADAAAAHVRSTWTDEIIPLLTEYVRIPALSPDFDPDWSANGHLDAAADLLSGWAADRDIGGAVVEVHRPEGLTPLITVDIPAHGSGSAGDTVLLYGHLDKQPPMEGWSDGRGPWEPVREGERLYGRGVADDGYALPASLVAIEAVRGAGGDHARCLVVVEASEESGSPDLPAHLVGLGDAVGTPSLVIGLDSGMGDWEHFWTTTSLRGLVLATVEVEVLTEGVHSGTAGGVVPSSFDVLRVLLDRVSNPMTGEVMLPSVGVTIPPERIAQAAEIAGVLGDVAAEYPFAGTTRSLSGHGEQALLARSWKAALEVTGLDGAPPPSHAGNVLRPRTVAKLSLRVPPALDARAVADELIETLTSDPPHGARITCSSDTAESGWAAPPTAPWLLSALDAAGHAAFDSAPLGHGEGGTIPFMGMLGARFPEAQFVITGVLGPGSNAHGPNEFLHIPSGERITIATAHLLDGHANR